MPGRQKITPEREAVIRGHYPTGCIAEIGRRLGISPTHVRALASTLGVQRVRIEKMRVVPDPLEPLFRPLPTRGPLVPILLWLATAGPQTDEAIERECGHLAYDLYRSGYTQKEGGRVYLSPSGWAIVRQHKEE